MMVPGSGPSPARGMIVGEAPGRKEVEQGAPFVGDSGKLLDVVLASVGVPRSEVYVTNVVKELPLGSEGKIRKPYAEEIEAWRHILEGEIESVAPASILALGRTAFEALTGAVGEFKWAGARIENVYGAWHPSYLLHRGIRRPTPEWRDQIYPWAESLWKGVDE